MSEPNYKLNIVIRTYTGLLLALVLSLVVIHSGLYLYNNRVEELPWLLLQLFDLDEENNIPTWFSSFLLLNNSFVVLLLANTREGSQRIYWTILAASFLLLALDEVAGLHETLNTATEINWAIPAAIFVLIVGIAYVPFLLALRRRLAMLLILSGVLYFSGALLVELLSEDMDSNSSRYALAVALEEGLEMLGALLCLHTVLNEMKSAQKVSIDVSVH